MEIRAKEWTHLQAANADLTAILVAQERNPDKLIRLENGKNEAGRLPFRAIIHVAGIGHLWTTSESTILKAITSALEEATSASF